MQRLALAACVLMIGCTDDKPAAPALPTDGGSGSGGVGGIIVGGSGGSNDDAGDQPTDAAIDASDAGGTISPSFSTGECVDGVDLPTLSNQVFLPSDFVITRGFAHWIGTCNDAVLEIGVSDGDCPDGENHELLIQIDGDAITDQTLFIPGANQLAQERPDQPIRVRYTRPSRLSPSGTWGTCPGVGGALSVESLDIVRDGRLSATFDFSLGACDGSSPATFAIGGTFDLKLARQLSDVCP